MSVDYFDRLSRRLVAEGIDRPAMIVDLARFDANVARVRALVPEGMALRLVAKSLPSVALLSRAAAALATDRLMTFSDDMLSILLEKAPAFQHLLGKPFPVTMARRLIGKHPEACEKVIWLIDTPGRAAAYDALATELGRPLSVAIELDVGLHRGGFRPADMEGVPALLDTHPRLRLRGFMGYEAHLAKLPAPLRAGAARRVDHALAGAARIAARHGVEPIVNTGGSLTFARYGAGSPATEVALGSLLVKPTDFAVPETAGFAPAAFIATPVLKYLPRNPLPGIGALRGAPAQIAVWGGYWKATPVHPQGYRYSRMFGRSSNQEVWSGPELSCDPVGGFAFLQPSQSEAVLSDFGPILGYGPDDMFTELDAI